MLDLLLAEIRLRGPLTVADYMEIALYHPGEGYYARAAQRSGRNGDFYTSVDVGPLFGALIANQLDEMWQLLGRPPRFDLVEAGAGNGRLARDILDAAAQGDPRFSDSLRVTLVERSAAARRAQAEVLGPHAARLVASSDTLPGRVTGVILANELLDALPVHVVAMTRDGLREIAVTEERGALAETAIPIGGRALQPAFDLDEGGRADFGHAATAWIRTAAAALARGFLLLFDYAYEPSAWHARAHPRGTLMAYRGHRAEPDEWFARPGDVDLTAHVDLAAIRRAAGAEGLDLLGAVDQTYFLLGLGLAERVEQGTDREVQRTRLAARTLMMPGGLGSTMKAMVFAKGMGRPPLRGMVRGRLT